MNQNTTFHFPSREDGDPSLQSKPGLGCSPLSVDLELVSQIYLMDAKTGGETSGLNPELNRKGTSELTRGRSNCSFFLV